MAGSFFKTTLRNLYREKMYTVINISGLSLAITCCLILGLYLHSELTYDRHHLKYRQIYRLVNELGISGNLGSTADTSQLLGPVLTEEYAEVKGYLRFKIVKGAKAIIRHEDKTFYWDNVYFADDNVFDVFTHDIIYGDPKTALIDPKSAAVSESFASKYFGDANPIGETISFKQHIFEITLVFIDLPENTHLKYDALFSYTDEAMADLDDVEAGFEARIGSLFDGGNYTYLLMSQDYDIRNFKDISDSFNKHHVEGFLKGTGFSWRCWIQPLVDIHLNSDIEYGEPEPAGNKQYLYGFAAVGIFILLVACINYMNLATARAARRAKEVGIKKVLGSGRVRLIIQFLGEAILLSLVALVLAIVLVKLSLSLTPISELMDKPLTLDLRNDPGLLGWMLLFSLVLGLTAGVYPALYLSSILPVSALVSGYRTDKRSIRLREILVLIQFTISICAIACTLIMTQQMQYVSNKALGFEKENRLIITLRGADLVDKASIIKKEISKSSSILGVSLCSGVIGKSCYVTGTMVDNNDDVPELTMFNGMGVDSDFIEVMGMELTAGRDFANILPTDTKLSYITNEAMVKKMGWSQPLGKRIYSEVIPARVVGVVKDFHYASLHNQAGPFALHLFSGTKSIPVEKRQDMVRYLALHI
jgi:putative ABC transport system permease protein